MLSEQITSLTLRESQAAFNSRTTDLSIDQTIVLPFPA